MVHFIHVKDEMNWRALCHTGEFPEVSEHILSCYFGSFVVQDQVELFVDEPGGFVDGTGNASLIGLARWLNMASRWDSDNIRGRPLRPAMSASQA
jgi:hypothetical protein